jgi:hypothetical protein
MVMLLKKANMYKMELKKDSYALRFLERSEGAGSIHLSEETKEFPFFFLHNEDLLVI